MKYSKFKKLGRGITLKTIRDRMREHRRRKEFVGRLKEGAGWGKTDDPGPY